MKIVNIIFAASLMICLCGCKNTPTETPDPVDTAQMSEIDEQEAVVADEPEVAAPAESYFDRKVKEPAPRTAAPAKTAASAAASKNNKAETIYVETDGAQGRVWGHVTMKGDRGTGTIHDWDENTLTVSVTRHGDELFAVDQNSRQYVFKLKK